MFLLEKDCTKLFIVFKNLLHTHIRFQCVIVFPSPSKHTHRNLFLLIKKSWSPFYVLNCMLIVGIPTVFCQMSCNCTIKLIKSSCLGPRYSRCFTKKTFENLLCCSFSLYRSSLEKTGMWWCIMALSPREEWMTKGWSFLSSLLSSHSLATVSWCQSCIKIYANL